VVSTGVAPGGVGSITLLGRAPLVSTSLICADVAFERLVLLVGKPNNPFKWSKVSEYSAGAHVRWYLASELEAEYTTKTTYSAGRMMAGRETIHQNGLGAPNPTRPAGSYDRMVYNDAFFANIHALFIEHPNALEEWLGATDRPMREIVTCEGDLGISTLTN
jgi:hypothetical protein